MRLELRGVAVGDDETPALPPLDASLTDEHPAIVTVATERGPMLASLIAGGRLAPDRGRVLFDGSGDLDALRRAVALVDTPVVAEPFPDLSVSNVLAEELMFAGRPSNRGAIRDAVRELGLESWRDAAFSTLPPALRIRMLMTLAARRPGVRALVLTSPERHGGPTAEWMDLAQEFTDRGIPVLVIAGHSVDTAAAASQRSTAKRRATSRAADSPAPTLVDAEGTQL